MTATSWLVQAWRLVSMGEVAVVLGMAALVVKEYTPVAIKRKTVVPKHVSLIALSYCLLCLYALLGLIERYVDRSPFSWRLALGPVAYTLGIIALRLVLIGVRERRQAAHPLRRATDPVTGKDAEVQQ
jgi:hypothetical protein